MGPRACLGPALVAPRKEAAQPIHLRGFDAEVRLARVGGSVRRLECFQGRYGGGRPPQAREGLIRQCSVRSKQGVNAASEPF